MAWVRICPFCGERQDVEFKRLLKVSKVSVLNFKDGRYNLEFKNNTSEEICCERCSKLHTIKELWEKIQNSEFHVEGNPDE